MARSHWYTTYARILFLIRNETSRRERSLYLKVTTFLCITSGGE